jgi:hypothetical protein
MALSLVDQVIWLLVLAVPIACVSWTVTHEEVMREAQDYCAERSRACRRLVSRKFFYLFTCEYCFSHYVALAFLAMTGYRLLLPDWRGAVIAFFALVAVANVYMSAYSRLRVEIRVEKVEVEALEQAKQAAAGSHDGPGAARPGGR